MKLWIVKLKYKRYIRTHRIELSEEEDSNVNPISTTTFNLKSGLECFSCPPVLTRRLARNIVTASPELTTISQNISTIKEAFCLFITDDMIEDIILETSRIARATIRNPELESCREM